MIHFSVINPLPPNGKINVDSYEKALDVLRYFKELNYTNTGEPPYKPNVESFICWCKDGNNGFVRFVKQGEYEYNKVNQPECLFNDYFSPIYNMVKTIHPATHPLNFEPLKYYLEYP